MDSRGNSILEIITGNDWAPIDSLPVSAKILLASRLMDGLQLDLAFLRTNLWHDHDQGLQMPRLSGSADMPHEYPTGT
jgi:hypothetical protein